MRDSIARAFVPFTIGFEGSVPFLYLDVKGLVTTAIGNLVDPIGLALDLPLMRPDGVSATRGEIAAEWHKVKARQDMALRGGMAFRAVTTLRLRPEGIERVVLGKLQQMEAYLRERFAEYETWPADAQLGLLSMAWACGPAFRFPKFETAVRAQAFAKAAVECRMEDSHNPGLKPRNAANKVLFQNAECVISENLAPDTLYYPADLAAEPTTTREIPVIPRSAAMDTFTRK